MKSSDKHPQFKVWGENPYNGEAPPELLRQEFVTPTELFYVRNHGTVPEVDPATYRLAVDGMVKRRLSLAVEDLRRDFAAVKRLTTLQCAGNRRQGLIEVEPIPGEVPWGAGAVSNGEWGGVLLRDVLAAAEVQGEATHVAFMGLDHVERHERPVGFGGSIPVATARTADVLLAYELNGEPLPPEHGFPVRVVTPGYIGARSVKWLASITLQRDPSNNYFQAHAYKLFPPSVRSSNVDWDKGLMLGEMSVNAVICEPTAGAMVPGAGTRVRGYATAGGSRGVARVDVSADGGTTWVTATMEGDGQPGVWRFWEAQVDLPAGETELIARAWDTATNTQPESSAPLWNFKGYMNNAWHRVRVRREGEG